MEQLTLEQAANNYALPTKSVREDDKINAFKAGAEWQKERLLPALKAIAGWPGNLPDSRLNTATGANDAVNRGEMVITMRQIAIDVIKKFEPDYKPLQD